MIVAVQQFGITAVLSGLWVPGRPFWPWLAGGVILVIGLLMARLRPRPAQGSDQLIAFGPLLFAIAMAIFGADHYIDAKFVASIVPHWIPGHLFWTYFVGTALIAAALSLATGIQSRLASMLLGIMIFLFVLLLHIPALFASPHDKTRMIIALRDSSLAFGALAFAASDFRLPRLRSEPDSRSRASVFIINIARFIIGITVLVFGVEQFLFPAAAPGIPQENPVFFVTMPPWMPFHMLWAFMTGAIFIACAFGLLSAKRMRLAATVLGAAVLFLAIFVYLPITLAKPSDIAKGLNYLAIHFALAGAAFFLARAVPEHLTEEASALDSAQTSFRRVSSS